MPANYWSNFAKGRIARRRLLRNTGVLSAGVAGWALVGCGEDDDDPASSPTPTGTSAAGESPTPGATTDATGTPAAGEPTEGGTLRIGLPADLTSLEPHALISGQYDTIWQVWERLTEYDSNLQPQARLAESWEINEDSTEFVFRLRQGVKFHNGKDFVAEDVAFNIDRVAAPDTSFGQLRSMADLYDSWETPDDSTLVLTSSIPRSITFDFFEHLNIGEPESLTGEVTTAIGTAPFRFGEWRPGDRFNLLKNADHWGAPPHLDELVFMVSLDPQTMIQQFEAGALEAMREPALRDFVRFQDDPNYQTLVHSSSGSSYIMGWNAGASGGTPEAFKDNRVRQALNWAIDRDSFCSVVLLNTSEPYCLPWPESSPAYEAEKVTHYQYDLAEARALLDAAGVGELTFGVINPSNNPPMIEFCQIYQASLAEIGMTLEIETAEVAAFVERINADPPNYNGMWSANALRSNLQPITMINTANVLFGTDDNNTGYRSEAWEEVIGQINSEGNPERLRELYSRMNDILIEDSWLTFLAASAPRIALQSNVNGIYNWPAREGFEMKDAWLS